MILISCTTIQSLMDMVNKYLTTPLKVIAVIVFLVFREYKGEKSKMFKFIKSSVLYWENLWHKKENNTKILS